MATLRGYSTPYTPPAGRARLRTRTSNIAFRRQLAGNTNIPFEPQLRQYDLEFERLATGNTDIPFGGDDRRLVIQGSSDPYTPPVYNGGALLGEEPPVVRIAELAGLSAPYKRPIGRAILNTGAARRITVAGASDIYIAGYPLGRVYLPHIPPAELLPTPPRWTFNSTAITTDQGDDKRLCMHVANAQPPQAGYRPHVVMDAPGRVSGGAEPALRQALRRTDHRRVVLGDFERQISDRAGAHFRNAPHRNHKRKAVLADFGRNLGAGNRLRTNHAPRRDYERQLLLGDNPFRFRTSSNPLKQAPTRQRCWDIVLQDGDPPFWRWPPPEPVVDPEPPPGLPPPEPLAVDLDFRCLVPLFGASDVLLRFGDAVCIPTVRRVYLVHNQVSVVRLPNREPINISAINISTDRESWGWSFTATVSDDASAALLKRSPSGPHEIEVTLNGYTWELLVEQMTDRRKHTREGGRGWQIQGRSTLALLAKPYAPVTSYLEENQRTAQQLINNELATTGWTLDWRATDWLIPAGVFTYADQSRIGAIRKVVEAFDGTMRQARTGKTLIVHDRYPTDPWAWSGATPEVTFTASPVPEEIQTEIAGPGYNGVYVSGETQGVIGNIRRNGTDGTPYGPLIVHPLITENSVARQRGRAFIAASRDKGQVQIVMPLYNPPQIPPLLEIGQLCEFDNGLETYRAQVEAVRVEASRSGEAVAITQTAELERDRGP